MTRKLTKRSVTINGHQTSVAIDDRTYSILKHIAWERRIPLSKLAEEVDQAKLGSNFSEALRIYALDWSLGHVPTTGAVLLRKLIKDGGGTGNGFLLASMDWALNKAGIVVEAPRGTV